MQTEFVAGQITVQSQKGGTANEKKIKVYAAR